MTFNNSSNRSPENSSARKKKPKYLTPAFSKLPKITEDNYYRKYEVNTPLLLLNSLLIKASNCLNKRIPVLDLGSLYSLGVSHKKLTLIYSSFKPLSTSVSITSGPLTYR